MPIYMYQCADESCAHDFEKTLPVAEYDAPQVCPVCGKEARKCVAPSGFVLVGDDWPGKAMRVKKQMTDLNRKAGERGKARGLRSGYSLAPNVDGEQTDSWSDAQKLAKSKGKKAESFEPLVQKEKRGEA